MMLPTAVVSGRPNPMFAKFPARLRQARKGAGLHAAGLSTAAGLSNAAVLRLEAGPGLPKLPSLVKLAQTLGVAPGWLAYGLGSRELQDRETPGSCQGLADRAREARLALGLSIREVARRATLTDGAVRRVELGSMPALDTLELLSTALNVSPAWLAFSSGPRKSPRRFYRPSPGPLELPRRGGAKFGSTVVTPPTSA